MKSTRGQRRRPSAGPAPRDSLARRESYYQATHHPLNCLLFLLPLIAVYELGSLLVGDLPLESPPQRVIAFYWIVQFLGLFTAVPTYLPGLLLLAILGLWHYVAGQRWRLRWRTLGGMAVESLLFCVPLLVLNRLFQVYVLAGLAGEPGAALGLGERLVVALTAGIYEELIFRLLLIWALKLLLVDVLELSASGSMVAIVVAAAVLFGGYHYVGREAFAWRTFLFRTAAGLFLGMIFVLRGFGITVGTHATYDVVVTLLAAA